jgi:hypothetical protein
MALAKVRALHPDFFSDEAVSEVSIPARLLFAGLWCFACDNGHLADKPKQIKRWIYATDDVNTAELLRELEAEELIERGDGWIFIRRLAKRQRIDHRYFKTCDRGDCNKPGKPDSQRETPRVPAVATQSPVVTTRGPATDGDGVGDGDVKKTSASADAEREFAEWYALYPRKKARADALKAYRAARKKATAEEILSGLRRLLPELNGVAENYRPYPASWLRSESWEDEPSNVHQIRTDDQGRTILPPLPSRSPWGN